MIEKKFAGKYLKDAIANVLNRDGRAISEADLSRALISRGSQVQIGEINNKVIGGCRIRKLGVRIH